jgi:hypothetical protein
MRTRWIVLVLLGVSVCLLAAALRFYRLGAWPFHGDELFNLMETDALLHGSGLPDTQSERLTRIIPLSYLVHALGNNTFGRDEFGTRAIVALLGVVSVLATLLGLLLARQRFSLALLTALLVTLWPQHVYYSQENRFYMTAFLFASLVMLLGGIAVQRRSLGWMIAAGVVGLTALFVHTILLFLLPGLLAATLLAAWTQKDGRLVKLAAVAGLALAAGAAIYLGYTRPLLTGWNSSESWSYSPAKSLVASVYKLGWPVALLAGLGVVVALVQRSETDWYWLTWGSVWLVGCLAFPLLLRHHPAYSFPLTLGVLVLASRGVCHIQDRLAESPRTDEQSWPGLAGLAWVAVACLLNLPSLASHYQDGSCSNYRDAARYVREHWQDGDRVLATAPALLGHYLGTSTLPEALELYDTPTSLKQLQQHTQQPGRVWIVVNHGRANRPLGLLDWLGKHCSRQLDLSVARLDAFEYTTTVYLYDPFSKRSPERPASGGHW